MNQERFDDLTRGLATNRLSRRQVLKGLAAGMLGAILGSVPLNMRARPALATGTSCAKQVYSRGTNFRGLSITADVQFFDSLDAIDQCARSNNVFIYVTDSYRPPGKIVKPIAGVEQAKPGNHNAGHAIDMNVQCQGCDTDGLCESTCLGGNPLPQPVQSFIDCVKRKGLKWGGDWKQRDPVHIEDGLKNPARRERIKAMAESGPCPADETCDANGVCTNGQPGGCNVTCNPPKIPNPDNNCDCECPGQSCAPPMAINPDTCQCECPVSCNPPQVPNPQTCECECPVSCNPPNVLDPVTCQCKPPPCPPEGCGGAVTVTGEHGPPGVTCGTCVNGSCSGCPEGQGCYAKRVGFFFDPNTGINYFSYAGVCCSNPCLDFGGFLIQCCDPTQTCLGQGTGSPRCGSLGVS